jgi:hypothetical protein
MMNENYLELIFMRDEAEAQNSPLVLLNRAHWRETGACPFGIALRGSIPDYDLGQFWEYKPAMLPGLILYIHRANEEKPQLPLLFVVKPPSGVISGTTGPKNWENIDKEILKHESQSTQIVRVTVEGPNIERHALKTPLKNIEMRRADKFQMIVQLDGTIERPIQVNSLLRIESRH